MKTARSKWEDRIVLGWACTLCVVLTAHFGATALYTAPHSGLTLTTMPIVASWIEPFFQQKWTLFAPEPLKSTDYLHVQCRLEAPLGGTYTTELFDVSSPLYKYHQRQRWGPVGRVLRAQAYPLFLFAGKRSEIVEYLLQDHSESSPEIQALAAEVRRVADDHRKEALSRVARVGSSECAHAYAGEKVTEVRVVWEARQPPPFSERHRSFSEGPSDNTDFGWHNFVEVTPWR